VTEDGDGVHGADYDKPVESSGQCGVYNRVDAVVSPEFAVVCPSFSGFQS